jgi:hypothetical protein
MDSPRAGGAYDRIKILDDPAITFHIPSCNPAGSAALAFWRRGSHAR